MNNKIIVLAPLTISSTVNRATAGIAEEKQPDLLYMDSVLVSTGENKNDDFFLPEEMWAARRSPILKPVDWEHNTGRELLTKSTDALDDNKKIVQDNQIIGAMYNSYVANKDGSVLAADATSPPRDFDIINQAVIYKYLFPLAAERISAEAKAGKLFVSMEAWFKSFDYKLGSRIVARNEETVFLDKHLRACGGDGYFEGQKISRVLRNICFGGIGIVANPANADSVIKSVAQEVNKELNSALASHVIANLEENIMASETKIEVKAEELNKQTMAELVKAEIARDSAVAELEKAKAEVAALSKQNAELILKAQSEAAAAKDASEKYAVLNQKIVAMETEARNLVRAQEIDKLLAEFIHDAEAAAGRKGKMVKASESMDDAAFAAFLDDVRDLLTVAKKFVPFGKKKDDEDKDKEEKAESGSAKASEDEGVVDTQVLENVKATASAPAGKEEVALPISLADRMKPLALELLTSSTKKA